jgi:hypothetical protein
MPLAINYNSQSEASDYKANIDINAQVVPIP